MKYTYSIAKLLGHSNRGAKRSSYIKKKKKKGELSYEQLKSTSESSKQKEASTCKMQEEWTARTNQTKTETRYKQSRKQGWFFEKKKINNKISKPLSKLTKMWRLSKVTQ